MRALMDEQSHLSSNNAALPAAKRALALRGRPVRIARRVVSVPASLYDWASGPPVTGMERERATLADIKNSRSAGTLLI